MRLSINEQLHIIDSLGQGSQARISRRTRYALRLLDAHFGPSAVHRAAPPVTVEYHRAPASTRPGKKPRATWSSQHASAHNDCKTFSNLQERHNAGSTYGTGICASSVRSAVGALRPIICRPGALPFIGPNRTTTSSK